MKKFSPLSSGKSPSQNPYEVRTYTGNVDKREWKIEKPCIVQKRCCPHKPIIPKVLTLEDQIRILNQKALEPRFLKPCNNVKERQRTPEELKKHAAMREQYIKKKQQVVRKTVDAKRVNFRGSDVK